MNPVVEFAMQFTGRGWIGIGFGGRLMQNTDMLVGSVSPFQVVSMGDYWSISTVTPTADTINNILGFTGSETAAGVTTIKFQRYLSTGDTLQDTVITAGKTIISYPEFNQYRDTEYAIWISRDIR